MPGRAHPLPRRKTSRSHSTKFGATTSSASRAPKTSGGHRLERNPAHQGKPRATRKQYSPTTVLYEYALSILRTLRTAPRAVSPTRSTSTMARAAPTATGHKNARPPPTSPTIRHTITYMPWDSPASLDKSYMTTTRQVVGYATVAVVTPPSDGCAVAEMAAPSPQTSRRLRRRSGGCAAVAMAPPSQWFPCGHS